MDRNVSVRSARGTTRRMSLVIGLVAAQLAVGQPVASQPSAAGDSAQTATPNQVRQITIVLARQRRDLAPPLSLLDMPPADDGVAGARLAINDNNTTGRFIRQEFKLEVVEKADIPELVAQVKGHVEGGVSFVVADATPQAVIALADALKDQRGALKTPPRS